MARPHRIDLAPLTQWITAAALQQPQALPELLMQRLAIGRRAAGRLLQRLAAAQWLSVEGTPRRRRYRPGALRQVVVRYALAGLQEDQAWRRDFAPCLLLPAEVQRMAQHAFTELVDNAVEHSGGTQLTVSLRQTPLQLQLLVSDDGCGLFRHVARHCAIDEPALAMLELAKGKLTSAPARHCGRGLCFTSRLADVFDVHADGAGFQRRAWQPGQWHASGTALAGRAGTSVYLAIALDTPRTLDGVLRAASLDGRGYGFETTRVPLGLLTAGSGLLASRADARRVVARLAQFRRVELDFAGIDAIGHGFADELLRVFGGAHPEVALVPVSAGPRVAAMLQAAAAG
ncbi:MAG: hypothetical protein AMXMBFR66_27760 [Pseudomonadota bacterium]|nr:DUF4325 domain-containing protein [Rubrivivax sp.]NLZ41477.1 DUF4325 domain-containing protein [Comamonadaceae bacterium]